MIGMQPTISCVTFPFSAQEREERLFREKNKFLPFPFPNPKEARITPSFLFSQNQTTPVSLFLRTFHVIRDKNKVPLMKLLHLLPLALLLLPSLPLPFLSVLVAASPFPSPVSPFFDSMAASPPGIPMEMESLRSEAHKKMPIVLIVCASFGAVLVLSLFLWVYYRRNSPNFHKRNVQSSDAEKGLVGLAPILRKFSSNKMVGHNKVSVPLIDYEVLEIWQNEVDLLSKIQHSNIIRLLGYTIHGESRLIVYEKIGSG